MMCREKAIRKYAAFCICILIVFCSTMPCNAVAGDTTNGILLTQEEKDYIVSSKPLTVAVSVDMAPMEYYDESTGRYAGVTVDIYNRISELTGLKFNFTKRRNAPELIAQMNAGEVQLIGTQACSQNVAKSLHIRQTESFYENSMSAVMKDYSTLSADSVVAVPAGYPQFISTAQDNGYTSIKEYETFEQCVGAVYKGEVDLTYIISMCEGYLLSHAQYSNLQVVVERNSVYGVCFGVTEGDDLLLSIMNKSISYIPGREFNEIIGSNIATVTPKQTFGDIFVNYGVLILVVFMLIFALIVFAIFRFQKVKQQRVLTYELQQHHDLLERLYENLPCAVIRYAYEAPHRILNATTFCAKMYGYDEEKTMVGQFPDAVVTPGTEADFQKEFERCEREGKPIHYIRSIIRCDGTQGYTDSVMDIVDTPQGKVFQEVFTDVTERILMEQETEKRYAQEIHKSGNRDRGMLYLAVFDITEQVLVETDMPFPGMSAGISVSEFVEILRRRLQDYQTKEEMDYFTKQFNVKHIEEAYEAGQFEQAITLRRCREGQIEWIRSDLSFRYNPTTGHLMCFDYVWDVSDEQIADEIAKHTAFANFEHFMSIYIKTGYCLQYDVDASGGRLRSETLYRETDVIRRLCERMTGEGASELSYNTELSLVEQRLADKSVYQVKATLYDEDGERRDKALSFFFLDEKIGLLAMTVTDVTEVMAAEVKHAQLLSDALMAAEKADVAKSQFLSRVSHEIRTPLNAIIGYGVIARNELHEAKTNETRQQAEKKVIDCLEKSDIASKHLLAIINDVLDMSAIESGKIIITKDKFDFKGLIHSLTTIFNSQAGIRGVDLQVHFDAQMDDWVVGDQMHINQVLTNLLSNAVKFTPEGGRVELFICPEVQESSINVTFTVQDTGIGMTEDYLERIWEPFEQADAYISRRFGGTGLGLTITKTLVDLMDGSIFVESKLGEGSRFTVVLSFERTEQPEIQEVSDPSKNQALNAEIDFTGVRILLVEDNSMNMEIASKLLGKKGFIVDRAWNGKEAVEAFEASSKGTYQVILMDVQMPVMDGYQATNTIRQSKHPEAATIPILAMTANAFAENVEESLSVGMNEHISKPINLPVLLEILKKYI